MSEPPNSGDRTSIPSTDSPIHPDFPQWTSANASEVFPGILPPLSAQLGTELVNHGFDCAFKSLGTFKLLGLNRANRAHCVGTFYGRVHLNVSMIRAQAEHLPFSSAEDVDEQYLGYSKEPGTKKTVRRSFGTRIFRFFAVFRILWVLINHSRRFGRVTAFVQEAVSTQRKIVVDALTDDALIENVERLHGFLRKVLEFHVLNSALASSSSSAVDAIVRRLMGQERGGRVGANLFTGIGKMEVSRANEAIWELSQLVLQSDYLKDVFLTRPVNRVVETLRESTEADAKEFLGQLSSLLRRYGYHSMREVELSAPSWEEDPSFVIRAVKNNLKSGARSPREVAETQTCVRLDAERELKGSTWVVLALPLGLFVKLARRLVVCREATKACWVRMLALCRPLYREIGRRLVAQARLESEDDLHFLVRGEVSQLLKGEMEMSAARALISERKREHRYFEKIELPEHFVGRPVPLEKSEPQKMRRDQQSPSTLRGIPVAPGIVTAKARVITKVDEDAFLEPGEILVAPFTNDAWTPLFSNASALVVDRGGLLSHGSIVARECGLPAVTNVKCACRLIETGDTVTVDGLRGEVILSGQKCG